MLRPIDKQNACACGGSYTDSNRSKHIKTKMHLRWDGREQYNGFKLISEKYYDVINTRKYTYLIINPYYNLHSFYGEFKDVSLNLLTKDNEITPMNVQYSFALLFHDNQDNKYEMCRYPSNTLYYTYETMTDLDKNYSSLQYDLDGFIQQGITKDFICIVGFVHVLLHERDPTTNNNPRLNQNN